jgi:hypothetical protein
MQLWSVMSFASGLEDCSVKERLCHAHNARAKAYNVRGEVQSKAYRVRGETENVRGNAAKANSATLECDMLRFGSGLEACSVEAMLRLSGQRLTV